MGRDFTFTTKMEIKMKMRTAKIPYVINIDELAYIRHFDEGTSEADIVAALCDGMLTLEGRKIPTTIRGFNLISDSEFELHYANIQVRK